MFACSQLRHADLSVQAAWQARGTGSAADGPTPSMRQACLRAGAWQAARRATLAHPSGWPSPVHFPRLRRLHAQPPGHAHACITRIRASPVLGEAAVVGRPPGPALDLRLGPQELAAPQGNAAQLGVVPLQLLAQGQQRPGCACLAGPGLGQPCAGGPGSDSGEILLGCCPHSCGPSLPCLGAAGRHWPAAGAVLAMGTGSRQKAPEASHAKA